MLDTTPLKSASRVFASSSSVAPTAMLLLHSPLLLAAPWPQIRPDGPARSSAIPKSFDCAMRKAAYEYGKKLQPRHGSFPSLYYALDLNAPDCTVPLAADSIDAARPPTPSLPKHAVSLSLQRKSRAAAKAADGSIAAPFRCIQTAADAAASRGVSSVVLRGGTYYLSEQIVLTPRHSGLSFLAYPEEKVVVSGGIPSKTSNGRRTM